jgi:hypothetical protein
MLYSVVPIFSPQVLISSVSITSLLSAFNLCEYLCSIVCHKGHVIRIFVSRCVSLFFIFCSRVTLPCATQLLIHVSPNGGNLK